MRSSGRSNILQLPFQWWHGAITTAIFMAYIEMIGPSPSSELCSAVFGFMARLNLRVFAFPLGVGVIVGILQSWRALLHAATPLIAALLTSIFACSSLSSGLAILSSHLFCVTLPIALPSAICLAVGVGFGFGFRRGFLNNKKGAKVTPAIVLAGLMYIGSPVMAESPHVLVTSTPTAIDFDHAIARHKLSEQQLLDRLKDPSPNERVACALIIWTKFPTRQDRVLDLLRNDSDIDVRRRIASVLAFKHDHAESKKFVIEQADGPFDLTLEASADLFLNLTTKASQLTGRQIGLDGALAILSAPTTWFADAASRYPKAPEIRKDALRTMAAARLADAAEMHGNPRFRAALNYYCDIVKAKVHSSKGKARARWEARFVTLLSVGERAGFPEMALQAKDEVNAFENDYEKKRLGWLLERIEKKEAAPGEGRRGN